MDILSLPQAYVRKVISDVLFEETLPASQNILVSKTILRLTGGKKILDTKTNIAINKFIYRTIEGMIESGKITQNKDGRCSLNRKYVPSPIQDVNIVSLDGERRFSSMGSDKYPLAWSRLTQEQKLIVNVIPELDNPKDKTAVSLQINGMTLAYFPREIAYEYHKVLLSKMQQGQTCITTITVKINPMMPDYKYAEISVKEPHEI